MTLAIIENDPTTPNGLRVLLARPITDDAEVADRWVADYCAHVPDSDVLCALGRDPAWTALFEELAALSGEV